MRYPLATETWTQEEKDVAKDVIDSGMCTMGRITQEFEGKFAKHFGSKYAVFSNSGSSANLLAVAALAFRKQNPLKPGDEVIVPAVSWSTSFYPLQQYGLTLVFVDISERDLNIDVEKIKAAITPKTRAILAVNLLGMPCNFRELEAICLEHNLYLIEDNCESMGAKYKMVWPYRQCGTFGDVGTFSTFFSHHICSVEGGVTVTDDEELYHILLSLRSHGWTRHLPDINRIENKTGVDFHDSFRFVLPGYNLRNNDVFAAIALKQLEKLDEFVEQRRKNEEFLSMNLPNGIVNKLQTDTTVTESSWFGFAFTCRDRDAMVKKLAENGIDSRPIVAGNFVNNPVIKYLDYRIEGSLDVADYISKNGFFIGNNSEDLSKEIKHFIKTITK
jgi:CDP-6-deoxy-D-xylo-4-hexulose-3-dehydrase